MALHYRPPANYLTAHYSGTCAVLWALLLLCNMQTTLLCKVTGVHLVLTEQPLRLCDHETAVARFVCNITGVNITGLTVNWFAAYNDSGAEKIGDSATSVHGRFRTSWAVETGTAELNIMALNKSDSGEYYCELILLSKNCAPLTKKSNKVWLNITGEMKTPCPGRRINNSSMQTFIVLVVSLGALAILCGLIVFMFLKRRRGNTKPGGGTLPVERKARDPSVYTLEYSVLEFQKKSERLKKVHEVSNVEYATIVFPPSLPDTRGWSLS